MRLFVAVLLCAIASMAHAQQQQPIPLTEWRAGIDSELSKLSMPRDAHAAIINLMQLYERQAQAMKAAPPPPVPVDPK